MQDDAAFVTMRHAKAPTRLRAIPEVGNGGDIIGCHDRDDATVSLSRRRFPTAVRRRPVVQRERPFGRLAFWL
jgi:hypothetical protein